MYRALLLSVLLAAFVDAQPVRSILLDDTFADGNSQNQDLANNSVWLFNGRTNNIRTEKAGSVTFDVTPAGASSEAVWAFFTDAGKPVVLGVGDRLTVSVVFSVSGFTNNGQDIRWGVLDSQGTRNTTNLAGGMNDATFIGDTGYGLDFYASGVGSPFVLGRRATLSSANVFNNFADFLTINGTGAQTRQALVDGPRYTLTYTIERLTGTTTRLTAAVSGGDLPPDYNFSGVESTATPATSFDYFAFRIGGTNFTKQISFYELKVEFSPAAPVINAQPQPSSLTVQVGSNVTMAVGASGSALVYEWRRDNKAVAGNASAATPTLTLANVQHADEGAYTAVVSNAGGSATSNAVTLRVSDTPVPPPPGITAQPADTTVVLGGSTALSVAASGSGLVYQWFKNSVLIPGATAAQLAIQGAQISDSGAYSVVISNSSGSVQSASAQLLVVSAAVARTFAPSGTGVCVDTPLSITFDQAVSAGKSGRLRVLNSQNDVVDVIDMAANPQSRMVGGTAFSYMPVQTSGNTAWVYLHQPLPYGDRYTVTMDAGVLVDSAGAPVAGVAGSSWSFRTRDGFAGTSSGPAVVAADGSGDFCTVQAAIDRVPAGNKDPVTITVKPGVYNEIVYVPSNKPFVTVRGADRDASVIQYANNNNMNPSTLGRPVFGVDAPDFTLENITIRNTTPKGGSQAEAFRANNQRVLLNRVSLYSYQDTLLAQGVVLVTDSYIEGDVDFMWGTGSVFIQNCEIKALSSGGYYTQIRNNQGQPGYVFLNNRIGAAAGVSGMYLARIDPTVFPYSQVVFINNVMGAHVIPAGWLLNNANTAPNVQFWEYGSTDETLAPLDVSQRATYSRQLSAQEAAQWSDPAKTLGAWVPYTVNAFGSAAAGKPVPARWTAMPGHAAKDWIGLYRVGAYDGDPLYWQYIGTGTAGIATFPAQPAGEYEFRIFLNDGWTKAGTSGKVVVR